MGMSEHAERERRTKRYLERLAQQQEADEEIKQYHEEDCDENCTHQRNPD